MQYLYQFPTVGPRSCLQALGSHSALLPVYPLLGSGVRSLGKGWKVAALSTKENRHLFSSLSGLLKDPTQCQVGSSEGSVQSEGEAARNADLVLVDATSGLATENLTALLEAITADMGDDEGKAKSKRAPHVMVSGDVANGEIERFDLVSRFTLLPQRFRGGADSKLDSFTGTGKGKTTSAIGMALANGFLHGTDGNSSVVEVLQWLKEKKDPKKPKTWDIAEHSFPDKMKEPNEQKAVQRVTFTCTGLGFFGSPTLDRVKEAYKHQRAAQDGLALIPRLFAKHCDSNAGATTPLALVLDELLDTHTSVAPHLPANLLEWDKLRYALELVSGVDAGTGGSVVTGRRVTEPMEGLFRNSVEVTEVKHPWSSSKTPAVSGLDF